MLPAREMRVDRLSSPLGEIAKRFQREIDDKALLVGTIGSGKTTELLWFREVMQATHRVLFVDLVRVYAELLGDPSALQTIEPWEVVFQVGLTAANMVEPCNREPIAKKLLEVYDELSPDRSSAGAKLDVGKLMAAGASIAALGDPSGIGSAVSVLPKALDWVLPFGGSKRVEDQDTRLKRLLVATNAALQSLEKQGDPVVVVIDGLDRIEDLQRAQLLFVQSSVLGQLKTRLLITCPFVLRHHPVLAGATERFIIRVLLSEPVLDHDDPSQIGDTSFLEALARRRTQKLGDVIGSDEVVRLAWASGGQIRDFVTLLREATGEALLDGRDSIAMLDVERAIERQRALKQTGFHDGYRRVLFQVMQTKRLPESDYLSELLKLRLLLPFPNKTEWFYPHPLLIQTLTEVGSLDSSNER